MMNRLIERLNEHSRNRPDAPALAGVNGGDSWTWSQLERASANVAAQLARELPRGSVVLLCAPNEPGFVAAFLGILWAGLQAFAISPLLAAPEVESLAEDSGAAAIVGARRLTGRVRLREIELPVLDTSAAIISGVAGGANGASVLLTSSGTTGRPRIVRRSVASLEAVSDAMCNAVGFGPGDHVLSVVPLCHSYGLEHGLLAPLWAGSCTHLCEGFDLPVIAEALRAGITIFPGVPFMFESLAHTQPGGKSSLRRAYSAGGPLPAAVGQAFAIKYGVCVGQIFGATEIGSVTFSDPDGADFNPASVGRPMQGVVIRINPVTDEISIGAPSTMDGYVCKTHCDSSLDSDGCFPTGDMGRVDAQGNLVLTGRLKLMIDVGGLKVNPLEVEEVVADHPAVDQCVVVPLRLSGTVTRLKAVVTARGGHSAPPAGELRLFVKQRLAAYKVPRVFEFRDTLPRSATGKILRNQM